MMLKEKIIFTENECKSIIWDNNEKIINWNMKDRKYNSHSIILSLKNKWIFEKLKDFFETETGLSLRKMKEEIHFHKYIKDDWFGLHNDIRDNRLFAIGVILNNDFEGGDFKLYNPNEITPEKIIGNAYIFDVQIEHEITPILEGIRYSLLWFLQKEHIKFNQNKLI